MSIKTFKKLAGVGAVALASLIFANNSDAAVSTIDSGGFVTIAASTTVNNTLSVTVTSPLAFGTVGTGKDPLGVDTATLTLTAAGVRTGDAVGPARVILNGGAPSQAIITVTAFNNTMLYADYSAVTNLLGTVTPGDILTTTSLTDSLGAPTLGVAGANGGWTAGGGNVQGYATTSGAGALTFNIGGVLTTVATTVYHSEPYSGSFNLTLSY